MVNNGIKFIKVKAWKRILTPKGLLSTFFKPDFYF